MLPKPKNAVRRHVDDDDEDVQAGPAVPGAAGPARQGVTFKLLSRDSKGRFETRQLQLPEDNQMAVRLAKAEETMKAEKQRLKERVLQIDQLAAEAEVWVPFVLPNYLSRSYSRHVSFSCVVRGSARTRDGLPRSRPPRQGEGEGERHRWWWISRSARQLCRKQCPPCQPWQLDVHRSSADARPAAEPGRCVLRGLRPGRVCRRSGK